jgi:hypothetical protein
MSDALDKLVDPAVIGALKRAVLATMHDILLQHGPGAFIQPRPLAVAHEVGHVIVAAIDGVSIEYVEVNGPTADELFASKMDGIGRARLKESGLPHGDERIWGGFTRFADSPFPLDMPGDAADIVTLDLSAFQHIVKMELGGIAGEHVLYDGEIPAASSLDERILSQHACAMRAHGNTDIAQFVWRDLFKADCEIIDRNEDVAGDLVAAFENKDRLEGPELQEILDKRRLH